MVFSAFRRLPARWQEVLWYTEIEQLKPAQVGPRLGMKPAAAAQLALRAREGLREAWVAAHLKTPDDGSRCQWTIQRLGAYARNNSTSREKAKIEAHLAECPNCAAVAAEANSVSSRLAFTLLPLTLGGSAAATYLATVSTGGASVVALAAGAVPAMPSAVTATGMSAGAGVAAVAATTGTSVGAKIALTVTVVGLVAAGGVVTNMMTAPVADPIDLAAAPSPQSVEPEATATPPASATPTPSPSDLPSIPGPQVEPNVDDVKASPSPPAQAPAQAPSRAEP